MYLIMHSHLNAVICSDDYEILIHIMHPLQVDLLLNAALRQRSFKAFAHVTLTSSKGQKSAQRRIVAL